VNVPDPPLTAIAAVSITASPRAVPETTHMNRWLASFPYGFNYYGGTSIKPCEFVIVRKFVQSGPGWKMICPKGALPGSKKGMKVRRTIGKVLEP